MTHVFEIDFDVKCLESHFLCVYLCRNAMWANKKFLATFDDIESARNHDTWQNRREQTFYEHRVDFFAWLWKVEELIGCFESENNFHKPSRWRFSWNFCVRLCQSLPHISFTSPQLTWWTEEHTLNPLSRQSAFNMHRTHEKKIS
jgi:hypothetical protein